MKKTRHSPVAAQSAPTPPRAAVRWTGLPATTFDLIAQLLLTHERLTLVERVCVQWRRWSTLGEGWGHTLDLLALPLSETWGSACARLGARLQLKRVRHVRCYCHTLTADVHEPLPCTAGRGGASDAGSTVATATEPSASCEDKVALASPGAAPVFLRCETLVLASVKQRHRDLRDLDVEAAFPRLTHLHVVAEAHRAEVAAALASAAAIPTVWELSGDREDAPECPSDPAGSPTARTQAARIAWAGVRGVVLSMRPVYVELPKMSHVAHLRFSCGTNGGLHLRGSFTALRSLQTSPTTVLLVARDIALPNLTHVALGAVTQYAEWRWLISAVQGTLTVLFDTVLSVNDAQRLRCCAALRQLHFVAWGGLRSLDAMCVELLTIPALRDAGVYFDSRHLARYSPFDTIARELSLSMTAATSALSRLTLIDRESAFEVATALQRTLGDPKVASALDAPSPPVPASCAWQVDTLHNLANTRLEFFGRALVPRL